MKWIGQHIYDFISRFRSDVYLEAIESGTIASGGNLGLDSNNKIVKAAEVGGSVDLTSEVTGILPVANGGSGANTLTSNRVLTGNGTSAIQAEDNLYFEHPSLLIGADDDSMSIIGKWAHSDGDGGILKIQGANASFGQTDKNGGDIHISAGRPTGSGTFGEIKFYAGDVEGTGTSLRANSLISKLHSNAATSTDFYLYEKAGASTDDYLRIGTAEHGATTIATIDGSGSNANLQITADGTAELAGTTVTLDSAADIELEVGGAGNYINTEGIFRGSNIGNILDNKIPVSPKDFISTNNRYPVLYVLLSNGIKSSNTGTDACAEIVIPKGYTASACTMLATDSDNDGTIRCYQGSTAGGVISQLAASASTFSSGTVTDDFGSNTVVGDSQKTVIIVWNPGDLADVLHGGYIHITKTT
tara:strand:+ start:43 stop:1293 length:1251 start_codon:yes stop_codon:yes gene_type:complete